MNYTLLHIHTDSSLLDSCTKYKDVVDRVSELNMNAVCFTEHGTISQWIEKKMYCESKGIKYIHGVEIYLTENLEPKVRDNYHTILIAKNYEGVKEINSLIEVSSREDHFYYKPRISFDEFLSISDNVIKISACLKSPLRELSEENIYYERMWRHYDFYEVQPHITNSKIQENYNALLVQNAKRYNKQLVATNDVHYITKYEGECRAILQIAKKIEFDDEDSFDLSLPTYDELYARFSSQNVLTDDEIITAINNTNIIADMVEAFELDLSPKYLRLYEDDKKEYMKRIHDMYMDKVNKGIVPLSNEYVQQIKEEVRVLDKLNMMGFMLFMSELICWCWENGIPTGPARGSVAGSLVAYLTDITDVNPMQWNLIFSRFANEDRVELGDIDVDFCPDQRDLVYDYIIRRVGEEKTAFISTVGTLAERGVIDEIGRALHKIWIKENPDMNENMSPYTLPILEKIKNDFMTSPEKTKAENPDIFYYYDGLIGTAISKGVHPAGIVASNNPLAPDYGVYWQDGKRVLSINMEEVHEVSLIKYDILSLNNIQIIRDTCKYAGIPYPKSHEMNWYDEKVWEDMVTSPTGIFQFSGDYAFDCLKRFSPMKINDMSLVNAALRPSGATYRDSLLSGNINKNPSPLIDELLKDNRGYLVFQEDTIKFLKDICGLTGSEADNIRRAIGRKQRDRLEKALPQILEGYCSKSSSPREVAEEEAKAFLQIIEDSANYQFGLNHSTGYSMIGYLCAYFRYYYPIEFTTAYLNNIEKKEDIKSGIELAKLKNIKIENIRFGYSIDEYTFDKKTNTIYKGIASIKYCNQKIAMELKEIYQKYKFKNFYDVLKCVTDETSVDVRQMEILIILGFFKDFGNNKYLLDVFSLFQKFYGKKQISKEKIESLGLTEDLVRKYSTTETKKLYKDVDMGGIIKELTKSILNKPLGIRDQMKYELEYLEYVVYKNENISDNFYFVIGFKTYNNKSTPYLTLYRIKDGEQIKTKITKASLFEEEPFALYSVLGNVEFKEVDKKRMINGKYVNIGETELVVKKYNVLA